MGIVLSNGDSFTYGDELPGSRNPEGLRFDTHHHHTFTHKLSEKLGKEYVNIGRNGSSNMKIFRRTMDNIMLHGPDNIDLLMVTWSNFGRFEICEPFKFHDDKVVFIHSESNMNQIIPDQHATHMELRYAGPIPERERILKEYVRNVLTHHTQVFHALNFMTQIQWICDQLNIPVIQGVIHGDMYKNYLHTLQRNDDWKDYKHEAILKYRMLREECRIGFGVYKDIYFTGVDNGHEVLPMGHVDENAHTDYANMLYDIIKDKELLDVTD